MFVDILLYAEGHVKKSLWSQHAAACTGNSGVLRQLVTKYTWVKRESTVKEVGLKIHAGLAKVKPSYM
jgi:hypothetical protein